MSEVIIIDNCKALMMDKFIDCLVNHNYSVLVVSGEASEEQLADAWVKVWSEYLELDKSDQYEMILNCLKNYNQNKAAIASINIAIYLMQYQYSKECADILRNFGYNYDFETKDKVKYIEYLNECTARSKGYLFSLSMAESEYKELTEETQKKEVTETDFDDIFAVMSKFMQQMLRPSTTTVREYISIKRLMKK